MALIAVLALMGPIALMALVALMAVMDPSYSHSLTPLVVGLTVTQGVFGGWFIGAGCMNPAR